MTIQSVLFSFLLASAGVVSWVSATPVTPSKCTTFESGILTTKEFFDDNGGGTGVYKPLAFNWRNELSFYHTTPHPTIYAEFQVCTPNYANGTNTYMNKYGRIYIPDTKECLAVKNADSPTGPYYVERRGCLNSSAGEMTTAKSIPQNWIDQRGFLSWVGKTKDNGSGPQGDSSCKPGAFGYEADKNNVPITGKSGEYRVSLRCVWDTNPSAVPFYFGLRP